MPVVSKRLDFVHVMKDGSVRVRERHTDVKNREYTWNYTAGSEAEAINIMNARDLSVMLKDVEEQDAITFISAGGNPGAFTLVDLTTSQFRRRLALRFGKRSFYEEPEFILGIANWIAGFSVSQIAGALSISAVKATKILDRATGILSVLPLLAADKNLVQEELR